MNPAARFRSVEGWIELGNFSEAAAELYNFPSDSKSTIEFLRLSVRIHSGTKAWSNVEMMCETLLKHVPEDSFALFHQAEAFHRQGRSREAFAAFQHAPIGFKRGPAYFYALGRYLCALGEMTLALSCLGKAFDSEPALRMDALRDPDLEQVWFDLQEG